MIYETKVSFVTKPKESEKHQIITLDSVKNYLKVHYDEDDSLIRDFIGCAMTVAENFTSRSIFKKNVLIEARGIKPQDRNNNMEGELLFDLPIKPFYRMDEQKNNNNCEIDFISSNNKISIKKVFNSEVSFSYISFDADVYDAIKIGVLMHIGIMYEFRSNAYLTKAITDIYFPYKKVFI